MIKLTERLAAVAKLVRQGESFADIGCDHGYLPVFLLQEGIINKAVASDINEGPLASCKALVENEGLSDKVQCILSNGLAHVPSELAQDIAICGMGGELIAQIMSECEWVKDENRHFIFNPMTHPEKLRKYLCENGFEIKNDIIVKEGRHYYNVLDAFYTGEEKQMPEVYYFLGNIKDFTHKEYFHHLLNFLENKQKGGADYSQVIAAVKEKI